MPRDKEYGKTGFEAFLRFPLQMKNNGFQAPRL
jgi:hypothetical protein